MADWNPRANDLFLTAAALADPAERRALLDRECPDPALRREVEALLAASAKAAGFLSEPAVARPNATVDYEPIPEAPGTVIGPYKLLQQIGEGGFGVVYMAEQQRPVRRMVALKIIKPGMDTAQVIARFESERQALALMDHPNIAKVLDAGATGGEPGCVGAGRPYFVMELVKGVPITEFCDRNHLPPEQRLKLFTDVCHAIQHAHHKGVIHRDVKPSNVMVTLHDGVPVVKVIDFGVAKATVQKLTERTLFTAYGQMVGTPAYMSPEQAEMSGLDIDTRSDVYSLGVLLYELLTGTTPLEGKRLRQAGYAEMQRLIREEEAPRPSTRLSALGESATVLAGNRGLDVKRLAQLLAGDLDWIVMKALEKDRNRRYDTPGNFADDVERYLRREVILARPPSAAYRLRKFAQRNRAAAATAAVVAAALLAGTALAAWQMAVATREANRAKQAEIDVRMALAEADRNATAAAAAAAESARLAERRRVEGYPPRIKLAWQHWSDGDLTRMRETLDSLRPAAGQTDLRGFEWHYLWRLANHRKQTFHHPHRVRALAVAPDGRAVATVGPGQADVWVWDTATGAVRVTLPSPAPVVTVAFAPDGSAVAAACEDGAVRTWDPVTGQPRLTLTGPGKPLGVLAYSADGTRLAAAVGGWTIKTGNPTTRFLPDGYQRPGSIIVWDARTGRPVANLPGHSAYTLCLAFSPDGRSLASGGADGMLRVWDVAAGGERFRVRDDQQLVFAVAYAPDGRTLVSAGWELTARVRDAETGRLTRVLAGPTAPTFAVMVSPDGREAVTAGFDRIVRRWDLAGGRETGRILGHTEAVTGLAADAGWRTIYTAGWDGDVHAWPADQPQECDRLGRAAGGPLPTYHVCFSPDSATLAGTSSGNGVVLYDVATRREVRQLPVPGELDLTAAFSPDGRLLVAGGMAGGIHRWETGTWTALPPIRAHPCKIWSLAFAPDGHALATGAGSDTGPGELKLWDPATGKLLAAHDPKARTVRSVAFSPDGRTVLYGVFGRADVVAAIRRGVIRKAAAPAGALGRIDRLDVASGTLGSPLPGTVYVAVSPDGATAAVGQLSELGYTAEVALCDLPAGRPRSVLRGHTVEIYQIVFSPDGKTLATASWDGTVRLWHVATGEELLTFRRQVGVVWSVAFAPDNRSMAIGAGTVATRELSLWDAHAP